MKRRNFLITFITIFVIAIILAILSNGNYYMPLYIFICNWNYDNWHLLSLIIVIKKSWIKGIKF